MIKLYSGTPGSGKSLHIAQDICEAYASDRPIITNFPLYEDLVASSVFFHKKNTHSYFKFNNSEITPELLYQYSKYLFSFRDEPYYEGKILLILDECFFYERRQS